MDTGISIKMMDRLFNFLGEEQLKNYNTFFISLNSILNTMFYESIVEEIEDDEKRETYINNMQNTIKNAIMTMYSKDKMYYFYYSSEESINKTLYPDWDSYTNKFKFGKMKPIFLGFVNSIKAFSKGFRNMKVIDTKNIEACVVPYLYSTKYNVSEAVIISRDLMDWLSIPRGFHLVDGNTLIKDSKKHHSSKLMCVPGPLLHKYIYLMSIDKHSYKSPLGPRKGGFKKSLLALVKMCETGNEDMFKSEVFIIFNLDMYIKKFNINYTF